MENFSVFLFLAVLKDKLEKGIMDRYADIKSVRFTPTTMPHKGDFFADVSGVNNPTNYLKFAVCACKLDIVKDDGAKYSYYFYFRNRTDAERCYTTPSSFEFGTVNANQRYEQIYKEHYANYDNWGEENNKTNRKALITEITDDAMSRLTAQLDNTLTLK